MVHARDARREVLRARSTRPSSAAPATTHEPVGDAERIAASDEPVVLEADYC